MTRYILSFDPGKESGVALGYYSDTEPFRLLERWQVSGGLEGLLAWLDEFEPRYLHHGVDQIVVEKFMAMRNDFVASIEGVPAEGAIALWARQRGIPVTWQTRTDKARLIPYPKEANTVARRQRVRFNFLKEFGLYAPGTRNDDSNDATTHILIWLKVRKHRPTLEHYWPRREETAA